MMDEPDLQAIDEYLSPTLDLSIGGKTYHVPSPPAKLGLRLQAAAAIVAAAQAGKKVKARYLVALADDDGSTTLEQDALGPVYDEMIADGVSITALQHAGMTANAWICYGLAAARAWWVRPLGEARRPLPDLSTSTSTGEATTTPTPASTTPTTSPTTSSGDSSATASRSPGSAS